MDKTAIRHAATVILMRDAGSAPKVLMGQRGANAAFMPNKFVFPGGAMDPSDAQVRFASDLPQPCGRRISDAPELVSGLFAAAIRELWEETGLRMAQPATLADAGPGWDGFDALPDPSGLSYVFRAITPPGRPRRFDARFFLADAAHVMGDLDDFSQAEDELSHLQWIPLDDVRGFTLPFITEVVLAEIASGLPQLGAPASVPFFDNSGETSVFRRIA